MVYVHLKPKSYVDLPKLQKPGTSIQIQNAKFEICYELQAIWNSKYVFGILNSVFGIPNSTYQILNLNGCSRLSY